MSSKSVSFKFNNSFATNTSTDIPQDLQRLVEDKDGNGVPDFADNIIKNVDNKSTTEIEINGKKYTNWTDVPPEFQSLRFNPYTEAPSSVTAPQEHPHLVTSLPNLATSGKSLFSTSVIIILCLILVIAYLVFHFVL